VYCSYKIWCEFGNGHVRTCGGREVIGYRNAEEVKRVANFYEKARRRTRGPGRTVMQGAVVSVEVSNKIVI
jgi:hypothetical protein